MTCNLYNKSVNEKKALQARNKFKDIEGSGFRGIITIEASIILPIVLIIFVQLISIIQMLGVYSGFLLKISQVGEEISVYSYFADWSDSNASEESNILDYTVKPLLFSELYLKTRVNAAIEGEGFEEVAENGALGISYLGSYYSEAENEVYIRATYEAGTVVSLVPMTIGFQTFYYSKLWRGYQEDSFSDESEESGEYVYITETGSKYHLTTTCTYLDYDISMVSYQEVQVATTNTGTSYLPCLVCEPQLKEGCDYYITSEGEKYHESLTCSSLKRTVEKILLENVGNRTLCSRCESRND
ncbi:MAG: hypothetical protein R3Y47_00555 [Lachnospiraceae bacterium]